MISASSPAAPRSLLESLRSRALSLGAANAFDYATQLLLPIVLVRHLDPAGFGQYRLLWLAVGTLLPLATLSMPASLYYFVPRSDAARQRLHINQTLVFLTLTGIAAAWALSGSNPWLPQTLAHLRAHGVLVPLFMGLWVIAALLDRLPSVDERVTWQSSVIVSLAIVRVLVVGLTAAATGAIGPVIVALIALALIKLLLLAWYVSRYHSARAPLADRASFVEQVKYAAPVGFAGAVYALRTQADQWVAASLFSLGAFAAFSIAAVLLPLMNLFRQSVNYAFLPSMSRRESTGDLRGMLDMNSHANVTVAALVCPVFAFAFVFAEELVSLVYTSAYVGAAPVMRVYIVGLAALVLELLTVTMLLRLAPFVLALNIAALAAAVALNWLLAQQVGLAGAAMGSVVLLYADRLITLWRISRAVDMPVAQLQNWRALFEPLVFAIAAAFAAWVAMRHSFFDTDDSLVRLLLGGMVLVAVYGGLYEWTRRRRMAGDRQAG